MGTGPRRPPPPTPPRRRRPRPPAAGPPWGKRRSPLGQARTGPAWPTQGWGARRTCSGNSSPRKPVPSDTAGWCLPRAPCKRCARRAGRPRRTPPRSRRSTNRRAALRLGATLQPQRCQPCGHTRSTRAPPPLLRVRQPFPRSSCGPQSSTAVQAPHRQHLGQSARQRCLLSLSGAGAGCTSSPCPSQGAMGSGAGFLSASWS
mmetsp:Transcript_141323/g.451689  ORF Transcript_141323/g.451689 Transcript_141323/m.451689 type:complete len:203 (-) Transcript_141323:47-655(-)